MAIIPVTFGSTELPSVLGVTLGDALVSDAIISAATLSQRRTSTLAVRGQFVRSSSKLALLAAQKAFLESLVALGKDTLTYPGRAPFLARLASLEWEEWTGNPVVVYTANFETDEPNPFTEAVVITDPAIGGDTKSFSPIPSVGDSFVNTDAVDEVPSATLDKRITLSGHFEGSLAEVKTEQAAVTTLLTAVELYTVTIQSGVYSAKVASYSFETPEETDDAAVVRYTVELQTLPDFTLEARALTGGSFTVAGVTFDEATSFSHTVNRQAGGAVESETLSVSGRKFFSSITDADTYRSTVDGLVTAGTTYVSATGKTLAVRSINWSAAKRDGHTTSGTKRYSLTFSVNLEIDSSTGAGGAGGVVLGVTFTVLSSETTSVSIDEDGSVTQTTRSGSGTVAALPTVTPGDSVTELGKLFYITSLNIGGVDDAGSRNVSVSGQTLDTGTAAEVLYPLLFQGFFFDHHETQNKSVSYTFNDAVGAYVAQSVSESVSGFKIGSNGGVLALIDALNRVAETFIITSVSTGAPDTVVKSGVTQLRYPISISGQRNLPGATAADANTPPDVKAEFTRTIEDAKVRFAQITIPGKGIVFKKIGMDPATETATVRHVARNQKLFATMSFPINPFPTIAGAERTGRTTAEQGLGKSVTVKWQSFDEAEGFERNTTSTTIPVGIF